MKRSPILDLSDHFTRFREADPTRHHLAAHSHHHWPDVAFDAHMRAIEDAAHLADRKWAVIFGVVLPAVQRGIAERIGIPDPATLAIAPNTHELILRLLSCFGGDVPLRILTTDSEFHSASRQFARLEESGAAIVERVTAQPFDTLAERFEAAAATGHDMVFLSEVFFNSGAYSLAPNYLVKLVPNDDTFIIIDGYHAYMARPVDISAIADRAFYIAGGYKYAMAGEGACFLHCPPGFAARPENSGWFAAFGALSGPQTGVPFGSDGSRFMGATFDPSGLYRMRAVLDWCDELELSPEMIHGHATALMTHALRVLDASGIVGLSAADLITPLDRAHGNFLCFESEHAAQIHHRLMDANIVTDLRDHRIRFGFGCYQTSDDIETALGAVLTTLQTDR
ncbi:MAG: aminotransferase class V-fold PLP-dependent enzyme [Pseudomonadota bacterium]